MAREAQQAVLEMQTELADIRASADAATVQSQKAFEIATEVFSNLIAAREAQRSIVERNLETFGAMDQRVASIESLVGETRRQRESDVAATLVLSAETELKLQQADQELAQLREQLTQLNQQNEQLRGAFDSAPMMSMLRELEATRRETSMLRGAMEEIQREQEAGRGECPPAPHPSLLLRLGAPAPKRRRAGATLPNHCPRSPGRCQLSSRRDNSGCCAPRWRGAARSTARRSRSASSRRSFITMKS